MNNTELDVSVGSVYIGWEKGEASCRCYGKCLIPPWCSGWCARLSPRGPKFDFREDYRRMGSFLSCGSCSHISKWFVWQDRCQVPPVPYYWPSSRCIDCCCTAFCTAVDLSSTVAFLGCISWIWLLAARGRLHPYHVTQDTMSKQESVNVGSIRSIYEGKKWVGTRFWARPEHIHLCC